MYEEAEETNPKFISRLLVSKLLEIIFKDEKLKQLTPQMISEDYFDDMYMSSITFKEIKKWTFGIWIERSEIDENQYTISYFGEHNRHIDELTPDETIISYEDIIIDSIGKPLFFETNWYDDFINTILKIKYAPYATYWNLYSETYSKWWLRNKYTFYFKKWLEYKKNER